MKEQIFKRKIYSKMMQWKEQSRGGTALLLKGARRVGKSTIVRTFAQREYRSYIAIDFSVADEEIKSLFTYISRMDYFFLRLQTVCGVTLQERQSVIIFDEVQLFPPARQAIKHLVADGRYDYIETGSLLSIKKNIKGIVIPSEETRVNMFPMDFEEFLWAIKEDGNTMQLLRYAFSEQLPLGEAVNRELMRRLRLYMLVGGMPQAVEAYIERNSFEPVDRVKRSILEIYADDFRRIDPTGKASRLFLSIPAELNRNTMRYKVGSVIENATAGRVAEVLMDMEDSMTVNFAFHANDPNVGMALHADYSHFKMYIGDTGLFVTLAFMDRDFTENELYRRLLSDKLPADLGYVYENLVAQMLRAGGNALFYYTFKAHTAEDATAPEKQYEIDFLLSQGNKICPIEVKSSGYKTHKSLDKFIEKYPERIAHAYLLYTKDTRRDKEITCLPVYMAAVL